MFFSTAKAGLVIDNFIAIDQYHPNAKYYFLSSAHHWLMLTNKWQGDRIYCSPITAKVLSVISGQGKSYQISDKLIRQLHLNVWHEMDGFRVMLIDANHAPGAVMLIIEGGSRNTLGRILYTGFFRADARFYQNVMGLSALQEKSFNVICIESTYADFAEEEFPTRRSSAKQAANVLQILKYNGIDNVAIPVPIIGGESFLVNIARESKCKIWLHPERFEIACILGIEYYFSNVKNDTYIWTCSQRESEQVISTTDSHIISTSMVPYVTPNILSNERLHMIWYSDHCSPAELRCFLSLLSFSRIIGTPNRLSRLVEDNLQNLSLPEIYYFKENNRNPEELLFDPFKLSWRIELAFGYALRKFCGQLSAVENLSIEGLGEMLLDANHVHNFIIGQDFKIPGDTDDVDDKLKKMSQFNVKYMGYKSPRAKLFSQSNCESTESSKVDAAVIVGITEKEYDVSVLLDYLASTLDLEDTDYDPTEGFFSYMNISKSFDDYNDLFEKYERSNIEAFSVGTMNQSYDVEKNIRYDFSNAPLLQDIVHEYYNSTLNQKIKLPQNEEVSKYSVLNDIPNNSI